MERFRQGGLSALEDRSHAARRQPGLVRPRWRVRRVGTGSGPLWDPQRTNEVWTIDYKGQFRTGDGQWCSPVLTVIDGYSRYLLACAGHRQPKREEARASLAARFGKRGLPERTRSDNGTPFASAGAGPLNLLGGTQDHLDHGGDPADRPSRKFSTRSLR